MSDSESDSDYCANWEDPRDKMSPTRMSTDNTVVALRPSEETFERWSCIPLETKREAGQRLKICAFWLPILLQREKSPTADWAVQIGLVDSNDSDDLSLKQLKKIETLEAIFRALERGTLKKEQSKRIVWLSNMFNLRSKEVLDDAMNWLEWAGEPTIRRRIMELGHRHICLSALHLIFTEFAKYIQEMGSNLERTMKSLTARPSDYQIEKSEEMKKKGNDNFQKKQYDDAVKFYSKAIKFYPDNHIIYGNRALCYIRSQKYLKAVGDGKRATLIKPLWAKGHYRYCEALFSLGEFKMAIEANKLAQSLCKNDQEGMKDLDQQHQKFIAERPDIKVGHPKKTHSKRLGSTNRAQGAESRTQPVKVVNKPEPPPQNKVSDVKLEKQPVKNEKTAQTESSTKNSKPSKSEVSSKTGKGESSTTAKKKSKNKNQREEKTQKVDDSKASVCIQLRSMVQDAHTALTDLRSRNAEQAFSQALVLLEINTPKELGLSTVDVLLLLYGRASALTEIGQPEELGEAQRLLEKIRSFEERTFQCLVYYAVGRVYLKENRFSAALEQFLDSLQTVKNQVTPGKLTWPLTKEVVKETQPDYFKEVLESAIELCKFPPIPDAICRLEKCLGSPKTEIYFTDPDFKGFIQICCCHRCVVEYHIACWKTLKTSSFSEKNEKDFLHESCLTPDCVGQICVIKIYGPTGLVKCKFEVAITKPQTQKKPKVNQKCTSLKKLKSKEEHRLKRKQHKQSFQEKQVINDEILQQKDSDSATQSQQKAWLVYRDRVLLQISQNLELLRQEKGLHVSALIGSLKPWLELDSSRGNQVAVRILNWQQEQLETLSQAVELLLERKNRVWARVLIQVLSCCLDINPKLNKWACQLNNAGLNASKSFIERYGEHLEQLDLSFLLNFGPLQDAIIEKLGTRPELFSSIGLSVTEYLKQASPHDTRLFIWTLEEHRDEYVSCHPILDEYFDMMDGHCSVLKKSDENQNNSPMKSRGRKKKQKEPKGVIVLSGMRGITPRDEWEQDFFEDDSLSFLHPGDPFSVPSHLREQVADFEDQYNTRHRAHFKSILDNNPDPTKESLYDYFAQILEEHGPLVADDPLLVGELVNFPAEAQQTIQKSGGFESFLLESLRFIKMGRCIGLTRHAVSLQQAGHGACLDDLDEIDSDSPDLVAGHDPAFTRYLGCYSSAQTEFCPVLPSDYLFDPQPPPFGQSASGVTLNQLDDPLYLWANGDSQQHAYFLPDDFGELDLPATEGHGGLLETSSVTSRTSEESPLKKHAEVQTCQETMRSVAVNTEMHEHFESCQGDINKKLKTNKELEQKIMNMERGCDKVNLRHKEDIAVLEEDVQKINANIQVTKKELALFQQKLEEEVKKDQKEKKANQEGLKSLKLEIDKLVEEQGSLTHSIREKKNSYDTKFNDFIELSNQSAAEKMSLEDEIKRCKALFSSVTRRSHAAQARYKEQLDQVKNGGRVSELPPVTTTNQPEPAAAPLLAAAKEFAPPSLASRGASPIVHPPAAEASAAPPQHKAPTRKPEPSHNTVFDKAMERLATMFPDYSRSDLSRFVQELRSSSGGSLSNMALQDMVGGVTQLILDHQEKLNAAKSNTVGRGSPAQYATAPFVIPAWQSLGHQRVTHPNALNAEDPCIICHEDMTDDDTCVLECRHSFHLKCIRSWLKEQSTCPTCRDHALLPEDFPVLPGRRRQAL